MAHVRALLPALRGWNIDGSRWKLLRAGLVAALTICGVISLFGCARPLPPTAKDRNIAATRRSPLPPDSGGTDAGRVSASRIFAGPNQYPPMEFASYGILAFRSLPSPYDRKRHLMFCNAYVATLSHASEFEVARSKQMVTVWPLVSDFYSDRLNQLGSRMTDICQIAVDNYGLLIAQQAITDAELTGRNLDGPGPFLLAWSPSTHKGNKDALVLVSDLSGLTTYEQALDKFLAWFKDIESDPALWTDGWNLELLRTYIRTWVDKYGEKSLAVFRR